MKQVTPAKCPVRKDWLTGENKEHWFITFVPDDKTKPTTIQCEFCGLVNQKMEEKST